MLKEKASGPKVAEGAKSAEGEGGSKEGTEGASDDTVWGTLKPMLEEVSLVALASALNIIAHCNHSTTTYPASPVCATAPSTPTPHCPTTAPTPTHTRETWATSIVV